MGDETAAGTKACPRCGAEYLARVTSCSDCGVRLVVAGETAAPPGEITGDEVVYDLDDWDEHMRGTLAGVLVLEGIAYRFDQGDDALGAELTVAETDAEVVEALIEEIESPDALAVDDGEDEEGVADAELLSAMYVASDVLLNDPQSSPAVVELLEAAESVPSLGIPYGLDGDVWLAVLAALEALAGLLEERAGEDEVVPAARRLREALHPLV